VNFKTCVTIACLYLFSASAHATIVVDQSFTGIKTVGSGTTYPPDTRFHRAQTFTVGIDGILNSVTVFDDGTSDPFGINILDSIAGTGNIVGNSTLFQRNGEALLFDVSALGILVHVGDIFAFEVLADMYISGSFNGGYLGGSDYFINVNPPYVNVTTYTANSSDAYFITTVDNGLTAVPEPSIFALFAIGLLGAGLARRRS
jgi:hypothetical protein